MAAENNRWLQKGSSTTPSGVKYGDDVILKDGTMKTVDENGNIVDLNAAKLGGHPASYFVPATKPAIATISGGGIKWEANWAWFDGRQVHINLSGRSQTGTDAITTSAFATLAPNIPKPGGDFGIPAFFRKAANDTVHFGRVTIKTNGQLVASADSGGGWMAIMIAGCYPAG